jgi:hypothetical protein
MTRHLPKCSGLSLFAESGEEKQILTHEINVISNIELNCLPADIKPTRRINLPSLVFLTYLVVQKSKFATLHYRMIYGELLNLTVEHIIEFRGELILVSRNN